MLTLLLVVCLILGAVFGYAALYFKKEVRIVTASAEKIESRLRAEVEECRGNYADAIGKWNSASLECFQLKKTLAKPGDIIRNTEMIYGARDLVKITGMSYPTILRRIKNDGFPEAVISGAHLKAWVASEVEEWLLAHKEK